MPRVGHDTAVELDTHALGVGKDRDRMVGTGKLHLDLSLFPSRSPSAWGGSARRENHRGTAAGRGVDIVSDRCRRNNENDACSLERSAHRHHLTLAWRRIVRPPSPISRSPPGTIPKDVAPGGGPVPAKGRAPMSLPARSHIAKAGQNG